MKTTVIVYNSTEQSIKSVLDNSEIDNILIIDDDNDWPTIQKLLDSTDEYVIKKDSVRAICHEFKEGEFRSFIKGIYEYLNETDLFGFVSSTQSYLAGKISVSVGYIEPLKDLVGLIYSDYELVAEDITLNIYQCSFDGKNLNFADPPLITKKALEKVDLSKITSMIDLYTNIAQKSISIHVPEILSRCQRI